MEDQSLQPSIQSGLDEFIQKITEDTGLSQLAEEEKAPLIANLELEVQRRLGLVALSYLSEEDAREFVKMTTSDTQPSAQDVATFLHNHILDFEKIMSDTLASLYREFMAGVSV
ncbi:MAG: hypothetical protein A3H59_02045 [Candidatus Jacksonbacteria bacterium RIFCSPLOWO2_02_FULL_43_9]|nr:MAG: hypothetical protein UV70_C0001G0057 [Parcubacteria group bacterium GW2011_GWA2_43_13]OGY71609.1 MAG: hypothetical protein A2986_01720 [Candidatus Jacksonbacteria bacterium RIFCSPLOWO2_01_FULL_44_13]OGY74358.1 MAG: hypothetical protein A3H59_02045 [Candidatus Jacksonbacteria bacterium RIFCSPLOWO2_02_FULL_43_9]HAZ16605.1 hypothetical protein [Candidatus Jacksonbacteria bacterium]